jgi:molecular chaperone DnaK (HSP70)
VYTLIAVSITVSVVLGQLISQQQHTRPKSTETDMTLLDVSPLNISKELLDDAATDLIIDKQGIRVMQK